MFTFSFSSAFAAASTSAADSQAALSKTIADALKTISYNGEGYVGIGFNDAAEDAYLSKTAIEKVAANLEAYYLAEIGKVTANWDDVWIAVSTADGVKSALSTGDYGKMLWDEQVELEKATAYEALVPDVSAYTEVSQKDIKAVVDAQTVVLEAAVSTYDSATKNTLDDAKAAAKTAIDAFKGVVNAVDNALKAGEKTTDSTGSIATAQANASKTLAEAAANFVETVEEDYATPVDTTEAARKASLNADVDKMVAFFEDALEYGKLDSTNSAMDSTSEVVAYLNWLEGVIKTTFATTPNYNEFYGDLDTLDMGDFVISALEKDAAAKKLERNTDGTLKYLAIDVDKALADAKDDVKDAVREDVMTKSEPTKIKTVSTTVTPAIAEYELKAYKKAAIDKFTTIDYDLSNWEDERADKVEAIQDEYSDKVLVAKSVEDIDALVKEAKDAMDAILTKSQINTLKSRTDSRITALDYDDMLAKYYDAVVGTKGYSTDIRTDALKAATDLIKEAVVAKENANLTYAEIDQIIKDNKEAAIAKVTDVKTVEELKAQANELKATFDALPTTITLADKETVLAAQKAFDAYLDLPGTKATDVINAYKLKAAMKSLMTEEVKAVNAQIKALPTNVTVADEETINAARAAYKALAETYGDYDNDTTYNYLGADIQSLVTRFTTLTKAETNLENAKIEDAAKKIEALKADSTLAEVKAAQAAYDALKLESKLSFNDELYAKLVAAQEGAESVAEENAKAYVQDLKIAARSTKTSKGVKVTIKADVQPLLDAGFTVEYKFYRSNYSNKKFGTAKVTKTENTYLNTAGKKGTKYYYKAKLVVKNAAGEVVATTPLTQCLYATRVF